MVWSDPLLDETSRRPHAQDVLSLEELEARIVNAATEAGWVATERRERTCPRVADMRMDGVTVDPPPWPTTRTGCSRSCAP